MNHANSLNRFIEAQKSDYLVALEEIKNGLKGSHWMWYIFPQIQGLGYSEMSRYYAIKDLSEAEDYLNDEILGDRLIEICQVLVNLQNVNANDVFGSPDDLKLKSSMTLFAAVPNANPVFHLILDKYFSGTSDAATLKIIGTNKA